MVFKYIYRWIDKEIEICVFAWVSIQTYIPELCLLRRPKSNDNPVGISTPRAQMLILDAILQLKKYRGFLEKVLTPGL